MRTLFFIGLSFLSFNVFAQQGKFTPQETKHNFGKVLEKGGKVRHTFIFTNTGSKPLTLTEVHASCGCTTPKWTMTPIPPKGKGFIIAEYNPNGRPGAFEKQLTIFTDGEPAELQMTIGGDVVNSVEMAAEYNQFFGYNQKADNVDSDDFQLFIETVAYEISTKDSAFVGIESSASHVPTKTYKNNIDLAKNRAKSAATRIKEALIAKNISTDRLVFLPEKCVVQGPAYKKDFDSNSKEYGLYQYVKASVIQR